MTTILFDAVGTLIYPDPPVATVYCTIGRRFGSTLSQQQVAERFHWALQQEDQRPAETSQAAEYARWQRIVAQVVHDVRDSQQPLFESLWHHFAEASSWSLYGDVRAVWRALQRRGLSLGIASNFDDRLANICNRLEPLSSCGSVFWSSRLGYSKPHPGFFQAIQRQLDLPPHELLLVGDHRQNDLLGGRRAGWQTLLINRALDSPADQHTIGSLTELLRRV